MKQKPYFLWSTSFLGNACFVWKKFTKKLNNSKSPEGEYALFTDTCSEFDLREVSYPWQGSLISSLHGMNSSHYTSHVSANCFQVFEMPGLSVYCAH